MLAEKIKCFKYSIVGLYGIIKMFLKLNSAGGLVFERIHAPALVAEWSKAIVSNTIIFVCVGSNPI